MKTQCKCGQPIQYGDDVAGRILICPSCQGEVPLARSLKAQVLRPIKWFAIFTVTILAFGFLLGGSKDKPALTYDQITFRSNGVELEVKNTSGGRLTGNLEINSSYNHPFDLPAGETLRLDLVNFSDSSGNRFQPMQKKITQIVVTGEKIGWTRFAMH